MLLTGLCALSLLGVPGCQGCGRFLKSCLAELATDAAYEAAKGAFVYEGNAGEASRSYLRSIQEIGREVLLPIQDMKFNDGDERSASAAYEQAADDLRSRVLALDTTLVYPEVVEFIENHALPTTERSFAGLGSILRRAADSGRSFSESPEMRTELHRFDAAMEEHQRRTREARAELDALMLRKYGVKL